MSIDQTIKDMIDAAVSNLGVKVQGIEQTMNIADASIRIDADNIVKMVNALAARVTKLEAPIQPPAPPPPPQPTPGWFMGVNLAGAEFSVDTNGNGPLPGSYGTHYIYPNNVEIDYYAAKGMTILRIPFRWERLQRALNGPLDTTELGRLTSVVSYATGKGLTVLLDPHNYGRYGTSFPANSAFADFWTRLAQAFNNNPKVIYGLMNEPNGMSAISWATTAKAALAAIRAVNATRTVFIPGADWTVATNWFNIGNDKHVGLINDPNSVLEVHQYLDAAQVGSGPAVSATIGVERLTPVTQWARTAGKKLFLGEMGATVDALSLFALDNTLAYLSANRDVWAGVSYWAGGPWWGSYAMSIEPTNNFTVDKPQMAVLRKYL